MLQRFYVPANPRHISHSIENIQFTSEYFEADCRRLSSVMAELDHDRIDLLKMNIEGAEGEVIDDMLSSGLAPRILCITFEQVEPPWRTRKRIKRLVSRGYVLHKVADWTYTLTHASSV